MRNFPGFFLAAALLAAGVCAQAEHPPVFSLSLDLAGRGAFAGNGGPSLAGGAGLQAFGDFRGLDFFSLGTGLDFMEYPGNGSWQVLTWDIGGRIFPLSGMEQNKGSEWYLQGELGLNLSGQTLEKLWPGNGHLEAGTGLRFFVLGQGQALDFGAFYDFYTPRANPLQAVGLKAGMTWLFGQESTPAPTPVATMKKAPSGMATPALTSSAMKAQKKIDWKKPRHRIHKDDLGNGAEIPLPENAPTPSDTP